MVFHTLKVPITIMTNATTNMPDLNLIVNEFRNYLELTGYLKLTAALTEAYMLIKETYLSSLKY